MFYKLRVKYRARIKTFLFNLILLYEKKKNIYLSNYSFDLWEREKVIEKKLFYFAMYVNHRNGYSDFNINSSTKKIN